MELSRLISLHIMNIFFMNMPHWLTLGYSAIYGALAKALWAYPPEEANVEGVRGANDLPWAPSFLQHVELTQSQV